MVRIPSSVRLLLISVTTGCVSAVLASSAFAQSSNAEIQYKQLLRQKMDAQIRLEQNRLFVAQQNLRIKELNNQLGRVAGLKKAITPMVEKMVSNIDTQINSDFPFNMDERIPRLQTVKGALKDPNASIVDKYRKALNIYKAEVNYGMSLETKKGNHPINPRADKLEGDDRYEKDENGNVIYDKKTGQPTLIYDGKYLRYGRLAYVYMDNDGVSALRYDLDKREWVEVPKSEVTAIRRAVRVASGEAAPVVVAAPIVKSE